MIKFDSRDLYYKNPYGAVQKNENIKFKIRVKKQGKSIKEAYLVMSSDQKDKSSEWIMGASKFLENDDSYGDKFCGLEFSFEWIGKETDLYFYGFQICFEDGSTEYSGNYQLTVYEKDDYDSPNWLKSGVMYQIFPDRFAKNTEYKAPEQNKNYIMRDDWGSVPYGHPDQNGIVWNNDFFGGNIKGVIDNLEYLENLGVTVIYLNPIFEAFSNHRYDTANYKKIDPILGNEEIFKELCQKAMERGIRVILDGVFNHTGSDSIYFNKNGRFSELGAYQSTDSKYYEWFNFIEYPNKYESWWGIDTLPQVKENANSFLNYILTSEDSVIKHWMNCGASGFRLDVADELPDEFLDELRTALKSVKSDGAIIGEVWEDASNKIAYGERRRYLQGKQLDSVMNYPLKDAIINFILGRESGEQFSASVERLRENYPKDVFYSSMNILGTHDTTRILTLLNEDWGVNNYEAARQKLFMALFIWAFMPGIPCIYYGDELGMLGGKDPLNRGCFIFKNKDPEIYSFYKRFLAFRKKIKNLDKLEYNLVEAKEDYFAFVRKNDEDYVMTIINRGKRNNELKVDLTGGEIIIDFFPCGKVSFDGKCIFNIEENSGLVLRIAKT